MKIVTTFHQPSSVVASFKCRLSARDIEHLVVAKLNRIQVFSLQPKGVRQECTLEIQGKICSTKALPIPGSSRSNLIVMLAHPDPELVFLTYTEAEDGSSELQVTKELSLYERTPRPAEFFNDVLVHPSGKLALASCYTGKLKVINLKAGRYLEDFDVSLPELNVFSLAFLPTPEDEYALAILHLDHRQRIQLLARDVEVGDLQLSTLPSNILHSTPLSDGVFPYPAENPPQLMTVYPPSYESEGDSAENFLGGVLVLGGRKILLFELLNEDSQEKQRGKRRRLEKKKASKDPVESAKAREKEAEREGKRRKPRASVEWPFSNVAACCSIDDEPSKFIVGDCYGRLCLLSLDNLQAFGLLLAPLGEVSPPTTMTYLTNQVLFVGSHMGDSELIQITPTPNAFIDTPTLPIPSEVRTVTYSDLDRGISNKGKGKGRELSPDFDSMDVDEDENTMSQTSGKIIANKGSYVSVVEKFKNIAPIADAVLVDIDGGGQRQIVTCSGGRNAGSLNIVRNGADFEELVNIPGITHAMKVWSVRARLENRTDAFILVSFYDSSRLVKINDTGTEFNLTLMDKTVTKGMAVDEPTIAFANVAQRVKGADGRARYTDSSLVVQVTSSGAFLLEYDEALQDYSRIAQWDVQSALSKSSSTVAEIVAASINSSQVALAISGGKLALLSITEDKRFRLVVSTLSALNGPEISAISCTPLNQTRAFSQYVVVAYWESNIVEVFTPSEAGFKSVCKTSSLPSLVSTLLFYNFGTDNSPKGAEHYPYLLAGLSDGSVATFNWQEQQLKDKKIISLGHAPVNLTPCEVDGTRTVLATGNRATIFAYERNRLSHSPILMKDIVTACPISIPSLKSSLIIANTFGLHIGRIKDLNKLHIRSIPFGLDNPRRIAYQPMLRAFGVSFLRIEPERVGIEESMSSSFKLLDDTSFEVLAQYSCDAEEEITSIMPYSATIKDVPTAFFLAGTFIYRPEESEPETGRLLLISVSTSDSGRRTSYALSLASIEVKGCVYALALSGDKIIAAVNSSVAMFKLGIDDEVSPPRLELQNIVGWNHNYLVTSLSSYNDHVFAGDQISSVSLLKVTPHKFETIARDYGPRWPVAIEAIDEKNVIGANDALNLFTFQLARNLNRSVLDCTGSYHVADLVTKIIRGSLMGNDTSEAVDLVPEDIFFTSSGRIGVIINVANVSDKAISLDLTELQRNMAAILPTIGSTSHARFRAPKSTRGRSDADQASFGFLDGDFIERLLSHLDNPEMIERIWAGQTEPERLSISLEKAHSLLEDLQSCH